jgi:hypothetical protein
MTKVRRRTLLALLAAGLTATAVPQAAQAEVAETPTPYRLVLPEPTGPYKIGTTELHLVDRTRTDPWGSGSSRELMASVWYPAIPIGHGPRTPYAPAGVAAPLADELGGREPRRHDAVRLPAGRAE